MSFGVITLDSVGRIVAVDDAARRWVDEAGVLAIHGDRPHAVQRNVDLSQRIAAVMKSTEAEAIHLGDADGVDLLLVPLASRADAGPRGVCMMLYLSGRRPSRRDISAHVAALFGLSDTQARLAMLLANGRTLAEIGGRDRHHRTDGADLFEGYLRPHRHRAAGRTDPAHPDQRGDARLIEKGLAKQIE